MAALAQLDNATFWTVVASSNKVTTNPDSWDARSPKKIGHFGTNRLAVRIDIQFNDGVFRTDSVKDLFSLDAEGSGCETKHEHGILRYESIDAGFDCCLIVLSSQGLDKG